jgi:hypothetical protein
LVALGRRTRALWIRPRDPAGLIPRLRWERGLEQVIVSLGEIVRVLQFTGWLALDPSDVAKDAPGTTTLIGRRPEAPLALIAVGRMLWGMQGVFDRLVAAAASWARAIPEADWLVLRTLDPRLEGPLHAMKDRPCNLLSSPPLPYPEWRSLARQARAILTDSPHVAAELADLGCPVVALGETPARQASDPREELLLEITPDELASERLQVFLEGGLRRPLPPTKVRAGTTSEIETLAESVREWLTGEQ